MKFTLHSPQTGSKLISSLTVLGLVVGSAIAAATPVQAQAAYGSYIGVGGAVGLTENGPEGRKISGVVSGRYKLLEAPVSLRGQVFVGSGVALVPTVSYDIPLNWQTDAYVGIGAAIPLSGMTPVGDKNGFAIQPGIDYALPNSNMVIFGNAVIAFDAYKNNSGTAATVQGGVGFRF